MTVLNFGDLLWIFLRIYSSNFIYNATIWLTSFIEMCIFLYSLEFYVFIMQRELKDTIYAVKSKRKMTVKSKKRK